MNTLAEIQAQVKAPKGNFNSFGKYKYRSAEDIVEAVKPIINPMGYWLTITDEIVQVGDRIYIKSTATLTNGENTYQTSAFAREEEIKKGMDASQVTGATSSYARKYALNGLFAIDDTKDADSTNQHQDEVGHENREYLESLLETSTYEERIRAQLRYKVANLTNLEDFEKAKANLLSNQLEEPTNLSQKDINRKVNKALKAENA